MQRFFNTAGPCRPDWHYMLPPLVRLREQVNIDRLIAQRSYFVIHAPRQVGKTTTMTQWAQQLTTTKKYVSVLLSLEVGSPFETKVAERAILSEWYAAIEYQLPSELVPPRFSIESEGHVLSSFLNSWAKFSSRPLVIFLDEIDALQNETLYSVLRQLRSGYGRRPQGFPSSLALIGLRDVRDYKIARGENERLVSPSPFNIAVGSFTLRAFNAKEVGELLQQHTANTGQLFTENAASLVYELTQGQPWLVNALAKICVEELEEDVGVAIAAEHVRTAKELLILRRQTHLDQLTDKLQDPRVRQVIEPLIAGRTIDDVPEDNRDYVIDLGLVTRQNGGSLTIANPIYRETIPRVLAGAAQDSLPTIAPTWLNADGTLNPGKLLHAFLTFWRQHGQPLLRSVSYHEIAPHLVLMAFLHRVVNGGGTIEREYAIGSGRIDLHLRYGDVRLAMELKVWRQTKKSPLEAGLKQLDNYLDGLDLETGWLVIFDQRPNQPEISERTSYTMDQTPSGRNVTVIYA